MKELTFKTYTLEGQEHYEYPYDLEVPRTIAIPSFTFPESLVSMAYLEASRYEPILKQLTAALTDLYQSRTQDTVDTISNLLLKLGQVHIYFELLRVRWQERLHQSEQSDYADIKKLLPRRELTELRQGIIARQELAQDLFSSVLDMDAVPKQHSGRVKTSDMADPITEFSASPLAIAFERTGRGEFVEVLYPDSVLDLMDYHLGLCLTQKVRMRRCKNCGKYFAVTGYVTAEYCNHPFDAKGRTCREIASILQWRRARAGDEVFKDYRREYKKRFARMRAGTVEAPAFYTWSRMAREKKAACNSGEITLEEFRGWLRGS